jgi:hypothetical protein
LAKSKNAVPCDDIENDISLQTAATTFSTGSDGEGGSARALCLAE